MHVLKEDDHKI